MAAIKRKPKEVSDKEKERRKSFMTVYPQTWAARIVGKSAVSYNHAIACWAVALAKATNEVEEMFTPAEWSLLAEIISQFAWEPGETSPGKQLAAILEKPAWIQHPEWPGQKDGKSLIPRLAELEYNHAWAVIWACQNKDRWGGKDWWKLAARIK